MARTNYVIDPKTGLSQFEDTDIEHIAQGVKEGKTTIYSVQFINGNASIAYVRFFTQKTAAAPLIGNATDFVFAVPNSITITLPFPEGWVWLNGLYVAATATRAEASADTPGASDCTIRIVYK